MTNRIHFQPASQVGNAGDQLINLASVAALRRFGEVFVNDLETPEWFIEAIRADGERRFSEIAPRHFHANLALHALRGKLAGEHQQQYLVLAPGHTSRSGWKAARAAFGWYARLLLLRVLGCRVVRAGFSIGPFDRINTWVECFGSLAFHFYGLRDRESQALARRFRFFRPRYFPDLAWSYVPPVRSAPAPSSGPVVVSFRSNAFGSVHDAAYLRPLGERLRQLLATPGLDGKAIVVAFQVESDREAAAELFEYLRSHGAPASLRDEQLSIGAAVALYSGACCVISNRLHVLLLAAQSGTLPVALARGNDNGKITSILADNGCADLVLNLVDSEAVSRARIAALLQARGEILQRLSRARRHNALRIEQGLERIFRTADRARRHRSATADASY